METLKKIFNSEPTQKFDYPNSKISFHISTENHKNSNLDILRIRADSQSKTQTVYQLILKKKCKPASEIQKTNICSNEQIEIPLGISFWKTERELEILEAPSLDKTLKQMMHLRSNQPQRTIKRTFFPGCKDKIIFSASQVAKPSFNDSEDDVQMSSRRSPSPVPSKADEDRTIVIRKTQSLGRKMLLRKVLQKRELPESFWKNVGLGKLLRGRKSFIVELSDGRFAHKRTISVELGLAGFGSILLDDKRENAGKRRRRHRVEAFGIHSELFTKLNVSLSVRNGQVTSTLNRILRGHSKRPNLAPIRLSENDDPAKATKYYFEFSSLLEREHFLFLVEKLKSINELKREWLMGRTRFQATWPASIKQLKKELENDRATKQLKKEKNYLRSRRPDLYHMEMELYTMMKYRAPVAQRRRTAETESVHVERMFQRELLTLTLRNNVHRSLKTEAGKLKKQISVLKLKSPKKRESVPRQTVEKKVDMLLEQKHKMVEKIEFLCQKREERKQLEKDFGQIEHKSILISSRKKFSMLVNQSEFDFFASLPSNRLISNQSAPVKSQKKLNTQSHKQKSLQKTLKTLKEQNRIRRNKQTKVLEKIRTLSLRANASLPQTNFAQTNNLNELVNFFLVSLETIDQLHKKRENRHSKLWRRLQNRG